MQPSAKSQYAGIQEEALGQAAKKVGTAVAGGIQKKAALDVKYTKNKLAQHRANAEAVLGEKKAVTQEREQRGITSFGDPETGTVFPLKSEAAMNLPKGQRRAKSKPNTLPRRAKSGSSVSKAQMNGAAPTTGANS